MFNFSVTWQSIFDSVVLVKIHKFHLTRENTLYRLNAVNWNFKISRSLFLLLISAFLNFMKENLWFGFFANSLPSHCSHLYSIKDCDFSTWFKVIFSQFLTSFLLLRSQFPFHRIALYFRRQQNYMNCKKNCDWIIILLCYSFLLVTPEFMWLYLKMVHVRTRIFFSFF